MGKEREERKKGGDGREGKEKEVGTGPSIG